MQEITLPEKPKIIKEEGNLAVFEVRACYPDMEQPLGMLSEECFFPVLLAAR